MPKRRVRNIEVSHRHGSEAIYYRIGKGPRVRLPGPLYSEAFYAAYALAEQNRIEEIPRIQRPRSKKWTEGKVEERLLTALKTCRARAINRGLAFDLDAEWLRDQLVKQRYRCALTGIQFLSQFSKKTKVHPFAPSIDRIVPALGYTRANTRVVVFAVNAMMMDWGEELFAQVARAYRSHRIKRNALSPSTGVRPPSGELT